MKVFFNEQLAMIYLFVFFIYYFLQITRIELVELAAQAKLALLFPSAQRMIAICFMILNKRYLLAQYLPVRRSCLIIQMPNINRGR